MAQIDTSIYANQDLQMPNAAETITNYQQIAGNREALKAQKFANQRAQDEQALRDAIKRDNSYLAESTLAMRGMKYQPTPDANGNTPRVIPGTEDLDVRGNWWYDKKTGEAVDPYDAPFYKPDGSVNMYSSKFVDGNVQALKARGATPAYILDYAGKAEANARDQGKLIREQMKANQEFEVKRQEIQKAMSGNIANSAFDIVSSPDPEQALQHELMLNPQRAQQFGIDMKNPPDSAEKVAQVIERLKPLAATSEKAKSAGEVEEKKSMAADRTADNARADKQLAHDERQLAVQSKQVIQGIREEVDPDTGEKTQVPTYAEYDKSNQKLTPIDLAPKNSGGNDPTGLGGATTQRFTDRIVNSANLAAEAIKNMAALNIETATTGTFGRREYHGSIMNTPLNTMANKITPQDAQSYNTIIAGLGRTLGTLETAGMAVPASLVEQLETGITAREGDTYATLLMKRAEARQIFEKGIGSTLARGSVTAEQKKMLEDQLKDVKEAIPFKDKDVIAWTNSKDKTKSFEAFLSGKSEKPAASAGPKKGAIVNGFVFNGGDPNDQKNWKKL